MSNKYNEDLRKCNLCGDEWIVNSEEFSSCKCGKNCWKGFTYMIDEGRGNNSEIVEYGKSYYKEECITILSDDVKDRIMNIVKKYEGKYGVGVHTWIWTNKYSEDQKEFISSFYFDVDSFFLSGFNEARFKQEMHFDNNECDIKGIERKITAIERIIRYADNRFGGDVSKAIKHIVTKNKNSLYWYHDTYEVKDCIFSVA